jgi:hypothetical protein
MLISVMWFAYTRTRQEYHNEILRGNMKRKNCLGELEVEVELASNIGKFSGVRGSR